MRPADERTAKKIRRRWLWLLGVLGVLAVLAAAVPKPPDELAPLLELHPNHYQELHPSAQSGVTGAHRIYIDFKCPPSDVIARLPLPPNSRPDQFLFGNGKNHIFKFPSGTRFSFSVYSPEDEVGDTTCGLAVFTDRRPWYQRAWSAIKLRLSP